MADAGRSETSNTGWIAKYGVPSLVLSVAVLVLQQQQQTFDRLQRILESGYQFYSSGRTALQFAGDGNRELSLLKIIGNAFPNVYCDVRQDMYERASKADKPGGNDKDGRKLIDSVEINALYEGLENAPRPRRKEAADSVIGAWGAALPWASKESEPCQPLSNPAAEAQLVAETPAPDPAKPGDAPAAAAPPPAPTDAVVATRDTSPAPPPAAPARSSAGGPRSAPPTTPPVAPLANEEPAPQLASLSTPVRVFFQIPADSPPDREVAVTEGPRGDLANYNYQVMRGVERVRAKAGFGQAEIRYYGKEQAAAAAQLKVYLDHEFRSEGLKFATEEIGPRYKGMPPQNIEVWVPSPAPVQQRGPLNAQAVSRATTASQTPSQQTAQ